MRKMSAQTDVSKPFKCQRSKTTSRQFSYSSLTDRADAIRLLTVLGADDDGLVHCELRDTYVGSVEDDDGGYYAEEYYAVSYMWGTTSTTHQLCVHGHFMQVHNNIWCFLNQIVNNLSKLRGVQLWIDAICIDQSNHRERNHQVRLMSEIYSRASKVLVWLGNPKTSQIVDNHLAAFMQDVTDDPSSRPTALDDPFPSRLQRLISLRQLIQNPYWRRMWIVQEIRLAQELWILHGDQMVSWRTFWKYFYNFKIDFSKDRIFGNTPYGNVVRDILLSTAYGFHQYTVEMEESEQGADVGGPSGCQAQKANYYELTELIEKYQQHECRDVRDRVIALVSLVAGGTSFRPDYSRSAAHLAIHLWTHLGGDERLLDALAKTLHLTEDDIFAQLSRKNSKPKVRSWNSWRREIVRFYHMVIWCNDCGDIVLRRPTNFFAYSIFTRYHKGTHVCIAGVDLSPRPNIINDDKICVEIGNNSNELNSVDPYGKAQILNGTEITEHLKICQLSRKHNSKWMFCEYSILPVIGWRGRRIDRALRTKLPGSISDWHKYFGLDPLGGLVMPQPAADCY